MPVSAEYFIGTVNDELVCHVAVAPMFQNKMYRGTRLVTMPEWQGAGVGTKFLEWVAEYHKIGRGRSSRKLPMIFHTSHPQLVGYLKYSKKWVLKSQVTHGNKSVIKDKNGRGKKLMGGHFRAIQGFKYIGDGRPPK